VIFVSLTYFVFKETRIVPSEGLLNVLGASLAMGLFIILTDLPLIPTFLISVPIYAAVLVLLKSFDSRDREFLARIIRK